MKKSMVLAVAGALALMLAACGYGEQKMTQEASAEASACTHDWQDATYEQPKTCTICGEKEGEALKDYFTELGVSVEQTLPRTAKPLQFVTYLSDLADVQIAHTNGTVTVEVRTDTAKEEGFRTVQVTVTHHMPVFSDDSTNGYFDIAMSEAFFDLYSGNLIVTEQELATLEKKGEGDYVNTRQVTSNGRDCEIRFNFNEEWTNSGWYVNDKKEDEDDYVCVRTYEFLVPADYTGLVYATLPISEYMPAEVQLQGGTAADYAGVDALKKATLIRVGQ